MSIEAMIIDMLTPPMAPLSNINHSCRECGNTQTKWCWCDIDHDVSSKKLKKFSNNSHLSCIYSCFEKFKK